MKNSLYSILLPIILTAHVGTVVSQHHNSLDTAVQHMKNARSIILQFDLGQDEFDLYQDEKAQDIDKALQAFNFQGSKIQSKKRIWSVGDWGYSIPQIWYHITLDTLIPLSEFARVLRNDFKEKGFNAFYFSPDLSENRQDIEEYSKANGELINFAQEEPSLPQHYKTLDTATQNNARSIIIHIYEDWSEQVNKIDTIIRTFNFPGFKVHSKKSTGKTWATDVWYYATLDTTIKLADFDKALRIQLKENGIWQHKWIARTDISETDGDIYGYNKRDEEYMRYEKFDTTVSNNNSPIDYTVVDPIVINFDLESSEHKEIIDRAIQAFDFPTLIIHNKNMSENTKIEYSAIIDRTINLETFDQILGIYLKEKNVLQYIHKFKTYLNDPFAID